MVRDRIVLSKRIVVKVGSSLLTNSESDANIQRIEKLAKVLSGLRSQGKEIVFVTSGAVAIGSKKIGYQKKPATSKEKQACAAVGQVELMNLYSQIFGIFDQKVAQILLTKDILDNSQRKQNLINTFETLLGLGIIPIVNENDSISFEEIENIARFGDNDNLASVVSALIQSDLLIILSDIDGYYEKNPRIHPEAKLIPTIQTISNEIYQNAQGAGSEVGTGGMYTKIQAAVFATSRGCDMIIANGENPQIVVDILDGKMVGTWFVADEKIKSKDK